MNHPFWVSTKPFLSNHQDRSVQDHLFSQVLTRLRTEDVVPMEGGPGCGKSLITAPLLRNNLTTGGRVIISAFTKSQQDTLYFETAPRVAALAPHGVVMLKGQANYICLRRARAAGFTGLSFDGEGTKPDYPWLYREWDLVRSDRDGGCSSKECGVEDAYYNARELASEASMVICNHKLLALNLKLDGLIFGITQGDLLCVDEAHLLERVLQETFGGHLTTRMLRLLDAALVEQGTSLGGAELTLAAELALLGPRVPWDAWESGAKLRDEIRPAWLDLTRRVAELEARGEWSELSDVRRLQTRVGSVLETVHLLAEPLDTHGVFTGESARALFVEARKFDVAEDFTHLTEMFRKTVVMSATMAQLTRERLGLPELVTSEEPFDAKTNRLAYCVAADPSIKGPNQWSEIELLALVAASRGGALVIANSHTEKDRASEALRAAGWRVGVQGYGSEDVKGLVAQLKAYELDAIVGTDSVAVGIDIPGDALRLVVLLSSFNPNPYNDVFLDLWSMRFGYQRRWGALLSKMADEKMDQAIGRLLRTPTDRGVVANLEPRPAHQKRFRSWVVPSVVTGSMRDVEVFFS